MAEQSHENLARILSGITLPQIVKLNQFQKGGNFSTFCDRFIDYADTAKLEHANLHFFLLQNVDDETYSILKKVELTSEEKSDAESICKRYKEEYYGEETIVFKNQLLDCVQNENEDISAYVFRLRETAAIAYIDKKQGEENCLLAMLRGLRNMEIRRKLNEASIRSFTEAVVLAKRLEGVERMFKTDREPSHVMRQSAIADNRHEQAVPGPRKIPASSRNSTENSCNSCNSSRLEQRMGSRGRPHERRIRETEFVRFGRRDDRNLTCWACKRVGHRKSRCRLRRSMWSSNNHGYPRNYFGQSDNFERNQENWGVVVPLRGVAIGIPIVGGSGLQHHG